MFPNYKCDFCNFDDSVENTTLLLTSFDDNKFVEIDQKSIEYMGYQQEQLINMIIESYDSMNDQQLFKSIEFLHSYLIHETPDQFPLLTCTTAVSALVNAFLNCNERELKKKCSYIYKIGIMKFKNYKATYLTVDLDFKSFGQLRFVNKTSI